jgi:aminomethyltransferase
MKCHFLLYKDQKAEELCQKFTNEDLALISNYSFIVSSFAGFENIIISKTGYTGSGGYELYIPNHSTGFVWDALFSQKKI